MTSADSIAPPFDLAEALVALRDHAHAMAESLEQCWLDTDDRMAAVLDPLVDAAAVLAAHADAVQHRVTGQAMTTTIGRLIDARRWATAQGIPWPTE